MSLYRPTLYRPRPPGLAVDMVGWWPLDGMSVAPSGVAQDRTYSGHLGTVTNGPISAIKRGGYLEGLNFNAASAQYIQVAGAPAANLGDFTVCCWFTDAGQLYNAARLIDVDYVNSFWLGNAVGISGKYGGGIMQGFADGDGYGIYLGSGVVDGLWHFLGMSRIGTTQTLVLDDVSRTYTVSSSILFGTAFAIGGTAGSPGTYWNGAIADARFYRRGLSAGDMTALYREGIRPECAYDQDELFDILGGSSTPLPPQAETNRNFIARFNPTRTIYLPSLRQNIAADDSQAAPVVAANPHFVARPPQRPPLLMPVLLRQNVAADDSQASAVAETNPHFLARPPKLAPLRMPVLLRQNIAADDSFVPPAQPETNTHFIARAQRQSTRLLPLLRQNEALDLLVVVQPETITNFIARPVFPAMRSLRLYRQNIAADDSQIPPAAETNINFIARATFPAMRMLPLLRQSVPWDLPPQPETNTHFIAKFTPTRHLLRRALWQNNDLATNGPLPPQVDTPPHLVGKFRPTRIKQMHALHMHMEATLSQTIHIGLPLLTPGYRPAPLTGMDQSRWIRSVAEAVNNTIAGKQNVTLDVTLTPSATSTIVQDARIGGYTAIVPAYGLTANGAAAILAGVRPSNPVPGVGATPGQVTLIHASNAATDQTIRLLLIG